MRAHIGKPLNELETRCCVRKGQRVMDFAAMMRKIHFRDANNIYIVYRDYCAYEHG